MDKLNLKTIIFITLAFFAPAILLYISSCFVGWGIQNIATWYPENRGMFLYISVAFGIGAASLVYTNAPDVTPTKKEENFRREPELWR